MTKNPDDDYQAKKLALGLREANLDVHKAWLTKGEHMLDHANEVVRALANREIPEDEVDQSTQLAILLATLAGSISSFVEASYMAEQEEATLVHLRKHVDHESQLIEQATHAQSVMEAALETAAAEMREAGIDAHVTPGGIVIHRDADGDDQEP